MLIEIITRFRGKCFETGHDIAEGVKALYNPQTRTLWSYESRKYRTFRDLLPAQKKLR